MESLAATGIQSGAVKVDETHAGCWARKGGRARPLVMLRRVIASDLDALTVVCS